MSDHVGDKEAVKRTMNTDNDLEEATIGNEKRQKIEQPSDRTNGELPPIAVKIESPSSSCAVANEEVLQIKVEPPDSSANNVDDDEGELPSSSLVAPVATNIKLETPSVKVEQAEATSSTRESCKYGIRCYRRNPIHRQEMAHYGDTDYRLPDYPTPPLGTPDCPFGKRCYRRHPIHFEQYSHPPDTDFAKNYKNYKMRLRKRRLQQTNNAVVDSDDESDLDPFLVDADDTDYTPGKSELDDDEGSDDTVGADLNSDQLKA